ncbi:Hypothetical predicted protein [Mytilus galloprovincialis]|uniref:Uncharacterized protein n=1 Tax=Mytilus galloprovincialis TaxID=29158 RepID=A0A8B6BLS3_MYTGA|nr:Hypothetical predicted protein [Mytilus galloprovincialis]
MCYRSGQPGHYAFVCRVRLDHSRKACYFQQMNTEAKMYQQRQSSGDTEGLLGSPNEVTVVINGLQASALLDTGSTVSTVSCSFHRRYLLAILYQDTQPDT